VADRDALIRKYNRGELPKEEAEAFEVRMINDVDLARDVELDALIATAAHSVGVSSKSSSARRRFKVAAWALAAGLFGIAIGKQLEQRLGSKAWGEIAYIELGELRGAPSAAAPAKIKVSKAAVIVLDLPALPAGQAQSIVIEGGSLYMTIPAQVVSGTVTVVLAPGSLVPGDYRAWATNASTKGHPFEFAIVPEF
jgi:hypothetical protein